MKSAEKKIVDQHTAHFSGNKKTRWFSWIKSTLQNNSSTGLDANRLNAGKQALIQYFGRFNLMKLKLLTLQIQQAKTWNELIQLRASGYSLLALYYGEDTALQMLAEFGKSQQIGDGP